MVSNKSSAGSLDAADAVDGVDAVVSAGEEAGMAAGEVAADASDYADSGDDGAGGDSTNGGAGDTGNKAADSVGDGCGDGDAHDGGDAYGGRNNGDVEVRWPLNPEQVESVFSRLDAAIPSPKIELAYTSNYTLLIAVMLSAQTTDKAVNKATQELFEIAGTPEKMVELGEERIKEYIRSIGFFNVKAANVIKASQMLLTEFGGVVPNDFMQLQRLPGIGRKSAKVVMNAAFGEGVIAVDTHVFRTANRIGLCQEKNVLATELALEAAVPQRWKKSGHHLLVLHGRYRCKALKPQCDDCPVKSLCRYYAATVASNTTRKS